MTTVFSRISPPENLHDRVTRMLAQRVLDAESRSEALVFPTEAELCQQLGVSRTIVREAVKVLADKGMIEVRPRSGTRARPRDQWNLLDPDILGWQAQSRPDAHFLRALCEVRLAIEPVAAGFAAVRATASEIGEIGRCLERREQSADQGDLEQAVDLDLQFHAAVMAACHNPLLVQLSAAIRTPFRTALSFTARLPACVSLGLSANRKLFEAIRSRDPLGARSAAEESVGVAMLAVEEVVRSREFRGGQKQRAGSRSRQNR